MDKKKKLEGIAGTHLIECRGINSDKKPVLSDNKKETVIVKIYKNGHSIPICRYLDGMNDNKCYASSKETDYGFCPYRTY